MDTLETQESSAIDFKIWLRRDSHLALWHAMACSDNSLAADSLAHIQIRLLDPDVPALAQAGTRQLLDALSRDLPVEHSKTILAHATQAMLEWRRARR